MEFVEFLFIVLLVWNDRADGLHDIKIQRGKNANIKDFPFVAAFRVRPKGLKKDKYNICTAILVDWSTAITAGHCVVVDTTKTPIKVFTLEKYKMQLIMGVDDLRSKTELEYEKRRINEVFVHENAEYGLPPPITSRYDLGGVKLQKPMDPSLTIEEIPMLPENANSQIIIEKIVGGGVPCETAGWGWTRLDDPERKTLIYSNVLQTLQLYILLKPKCCETFFGSLVDRCMDSLGNDSAYQCFTYSRAEFGVSLTDADAGSPLVCSYDGKRYVVGMTLPGVKTVAYQRGDQVDVYNPGFYVDEEVMREFIYDMVAIPVGAIVINGGPSRGSPGFVPLTLIGFICNFIKLRV